MSETMRWRIGSPDGHSADLVDTYKQPNLLGDVTWTVGAQGQRWPLFHPSEADPLGGYRPHPYTVAFALDHAPRGAYLLRVAYLTIAPRLGRLELTVNGTVGRAYPRPSPSRSGEIQLLAGLHTAIYAEGVEAVYVAFPFDLPGAAVYSDAQLGWVHWDQDELPGGCKEWLPLQSGVLVRDAEASVLLLSPDIPLFCVGDIVRGRWPKEADLMGGRILSYVLNNYWHTNYKASQGGEITFRYAITSDRAIPYERAFRLGRQARRPLYAQRMSLQNFRSARSPYERADGVLARIDSDEGAAGEVVLSTLKGARWGAGFVARLQEIAGRPGRAIISFPGRMITGAWATDLLERELGALPVGPDGTLGVNVPAWGLATVRFTIGDVL